MLVKYPHDLTCVHSRTAAECDDNIGLELLHQLCTFLSASKRRIGSNVEEYCMRNAHLIELICDSLCVAVMI